MTLESPRDLSADSPIAQRLLSEDHLSSGSVLFHLKILDRQNLKSKKVLSREVLDDEIPNDDAWLRYTWQGRKLWRIDLYDPNHAPLRSMVFDGKSVDTGDAIWDRRFFTRSLSGDLARTFDQLIWPYEIVSTDHLFQLTLGRKWSAADWSFMYDLKYENVNSVHDLPQIRVTVTMSTPRLVMTGPDRDGWAAIVKRQNDSMAASDVLIFIQSLTLDAAHGFLPVSRRTTIGVKTNEALETKEALEWSEPIKVGVGTWIPRVCRRLKDDNTANPVWSCEISEGDSTFGAEASKDDFSIHDDGTKVHVNWPTSK